MTDRSEEELASHYRARAFGYLAAAVVVALLACAAPVLLGKLTRAW